MVDTDSSPLPLKGRRRRLNLFGPAVPPRLHEEKKGHLSRLLNLHPNPSGGASTAAAQLGTHAQALLQRQPLAPPANPARFFSPPSELHSVPCDAAAAPLAVEQSLALLLHRLQRDAGAGSLSPCDATSAAAAVKDVLLQSHTVPAKSLDLALSCVTVLASFQAGDLAARAAAADQDPLPAQPCSPAVVRHHPSPWAAPQTIRPDQLPADYGGRVVPYTVPYPPVVLPLVPLLAAVAAADESAAQAALHRLNRRLARPISTAADAAEYGTAPHSSRSGAGSGAASHETGALPRGRSEGGSSSHAGPSSCCSDALTLSSISSFGDVRSSETGSGAWGHALARTGGSVEGASLDGGGSHSGSGSGSSWASLKGGSHLSCCSSLRAARQAEEQMTREGEACRAAAARLCGRSALSESAVAEADLLRGACVAALAAAAADVRCHQELLCSPLLEALPRILRAPTSGPFAAVLVHNLALPPSASFRSQLRRRGVLACLFDYLPRLVPPSGPTQREDSHAHPAAGDTAWRQHQRDTAAAASRGRSPDLSGLAVTLTSITHLASGREGVEALRQPRLCALKRLAALRQRLGSGLGPAGGRGPCGSPDRSPVAGDGAGAGAGAGGAVSVEGGEAVALEGCLGEGGGAGADKEAAVEGAVVDSLLRGLLAAVGFNEVEQPRGKWGGAAGAPAEVSTRGRGPPLAAAALTSHQPAAAAAAGEGGGARGPERGEGDAAAASITFHSHVLVDGRPLQLLSVITRTTRLRADGSEDVHYQIQDQVSPHPDPDEPRQTLTGGGYGTCVGEARPEPQGPCYRSSSSWLQAGEGRRKAAAAPEADDDARDVRRSPAPDQLRAPGEGRDGGGGGGGVAGSEGASPASSSDQRAYGGEPDCQVAATPQPSAAQRHLGQLAMEAGNYLSVARLGPGRRKGPASD